MDKLLRLPQVMELTGLAKSTVWLWVSQGRFPRPIKMTSRVSVWRESTIEQWIDEVMDGKFK